VSKVIQFPGGDEKAIGKAPRERTVPAIDILEGAVRSSEELEMLVCIGLTTDGDLFTSSTHPDIADILLMMDRVRARLMMAFAEDRFG
jgi:hypothetical protein